ncbi:DUF4920 domain-containing protein [bacterium]|nr:DUF4920 domain-containing protein [bacterium]
MRKIILVSMALCSLLAVAAQADKAETVYGQGVSGSDTVLVSTLLANPDAYVGKTIRVKGTAVGVCEHRGCWVNLASDVEGETVRVKVKDGVIVFPPEMLGDTVLAEGVWTANELDLETTKKVCEMEAKKDGKDFDAASVTTCMTLYQLSGTGAVVAKK